MTFRRFATGAALAIAGLAAAVGIGLLANSISGDSVGLGAEPLSAGETLAPATVKAENRQRQRQRRRRNRGGDDRRADTVQVPPASDDGGTVTTFDDHGGDRVRTDDNSGSGSSSSGSGSSGSSGSGSGDSSHSGGSDDD